MSDMPNPTPPQNQPPYPQGTPQPGSAQPQPPAYPGNQPQPPYPGNQPQQPPAYPGVPPQQPYPGAMPQQAGYAGQAGYQQPGYPMQPGYPAAPGPGGIKYDANGKPKYPGLYLAAIIVLAIGFVAATISVISSFNTVGEVATYLGENHEITGTVRTLAWVALATLLINAVGYVGIVLGLAWGRIVYGAMFVLNLIVVIIIVGGFAGLAIDGSAILSIVLPILVIIALWVTPSTNYLKAMAQWRARQQGAAPTM